MLQVIIFSKNRALQLDLLIRSIKKYFKDYDKYKFRVIHTASSDQFKKGYDKITEICPDLNLISETSFRGNLIDSIDPKIPYLMFLTDDDLFKDFFSVESTEFVMFASNKDVVALSLRLGKNITHCYTEDIPTPPPESNIFDWRNLKGDWGYPASVDGNIFRTDFIFPIIKNLFFSNPNTFETALVIATGYFPPMMVCFKSSVLFNIPANRVQNVYQNKSGDVSPEMLNDNFLLGYRIILEDFHKIQNNSCHFPCKIRLYNGTK